MLKDFLNNFKLYVVNIRWYGNICKRILLKFLQIFASKRIFWSTYSPVSENLSRISLWSEYLLQHVFLHQIEYLFANLCEYFEANDVNKRFFYIPKHANMKRIRSIIAWIRFEVNFKKLWIRRTEVVIMGERGLDMPLPIAFQSPSPILLSPSP